MVPQRLLPVSYTHLILYPEVAEQLRALIEVMDALYPEDLVMNGYHGFLFRNRSGYFLSAHNINRAIERISIAYKDVYKRQFSDCGTVFRSEVE